MKLTRDHLYGMGTVAVIFALGLLVGYIMGCAT